MFSRWDQMLILGHWLDCLLEGFSFPKNDVAIFGCHFLVVFSQI